MKGRAMPQTSSKDTAATKDQAERAWRAFRDQLEAIRAETGGELLNYPQPTAGCDLHYRDLLERRTRVNQELAELDANPPGDGGNAEDWLARFEGLVRSSRFIDKAALENSPAKA
jgi:hypothetical protein